MRYGASLRFMTVVSIPNHGALGRHTQLIVDHRSLLKNTLLINRSTYVLASVGFQRKKNTLISQICLEIYFHSLFISFLFTYLCFFFITLLSFPNIFLRIYLLTDNRIFIHNCFFWNTTPWGPADIDVSEKHDLLLQGLVFIRPHLLIPLFLFIHSLFM